MTPRIEVDLRFWTPYMIWVWVQNFKSNLNCRKFDSIWFVYSHTHRRIHHSFRIVWIVIFQSFCNKMHCSCLIYVKQKCDYKIYSWKTYRNTCICTVLFYFLFLFIHSLWIFGWLKLSCHQNNPEKQSVWMSIFLKYYFAYIINTFLIIFLF